MDALKQKVVDWASKQRAETIILILILGMITVLFWYGLPWLVFEMKDYGERTMVPVIEAFREDQERDAQRQAIRDAREERKDELIYELLQRERSGYAGEWEPARDLQ